MNDKTNNLEEMDFLGELEAKIFKVELVIKDIAYSHMRYNEDDSEENLLNAFKETLIRADMIRDYMDSIEESINQRKQAINEQMSEILEEMNNDHKGNLH